MVKLETMLYLSYIGITLGITLTILGMLITCLGAEIIKPEFLWFLKGMPGPTLSDHFSITNGDVINTGFIAMFIGLWQTDKALDDKNKVLDLMDEQNINEPSPIPT
jgi:hypothetical protein